MARGRHRRDAEADHAELDLEQSPSRIINVLWGSVGALKEDRHAPSGSAGAYRHAERVRFRRAKVHVPVFSTGLLVAFVMAPLLCLKIGSKTDSELRPNSSALLASLNSAVAALAYSPDGHSLAWSGWDGTLAVHALRVVDRTEVISETPLEKGEVGKCLAFSPDGSYLAVGLYDGRVNLWNPRTGTSRWLADRVGSTARAVAFAPDRAVLVTGHADSLIRRWDLSTGEQRESLDGTGASISGLAFSPDGRTLASSGTDGRVVLWEWPTGRRLTTWRPESGIVCPDHYPLSQIALVPNGKTHTVIAQGSQITVWDVPTGKCIAKLGDGTRVFVSLAVSGDGNLLAAAGADGSIHCWDTDAYQCRGILRAHQGAVSALAFSPDGQRLVSAGTDRTVRMWPHDRDFAPSP